MAISALTTLSNARFMATTPEYNPHDPVIMPTHSTSEAGYVEPVQTPHAHDFAKLPLPKNTSKLKLILAGSLLLVSLVGLLFGYKVGYYQGESYASEKAKQALGGEELTAEDIKAMRGQVELLKSQLSTAQQERDISLSNLADLRTTNDQLKTVNLQFQQNDDIFTKLLAKEGGIPLQIIGAKIAPLPENAFEYRLDVAMLDKSNQVKKLLPKLTLLDDSHMVDVPLEPNSYDVHGIARVRGRFLMPQGFTPKQVKVELTAGTEKIEQIYDWQLGQPVDNMPYSLAETPNADQRPLAIDPETQSTANSVKTDVGKVKNAPKTADVKTPKETANHKTDISLKSAATSNKMKTADTDE